MDNDEILRTVAQHTVAGSSSALMVFHHVYEGEETPDATILIEVRDWFIETWGPAWQTLASDEATLNSVHLQVMNLDGTVKREVGIGAVGLTGTNITEVLPAANSGYLQAATAVPGHRGRKFVPGIAESNVAGGVWASGAQTGLLNLAALYTSAIAVGAVGELHPGLLSRTLVQFLRFIGTGTISSVPAYQRRRKPNVGT